MSETAPRREHFALRASLTLAEVCDALRARLGLPVFHYDSENETEWGVVQHDGLEYNVSRPFESNRLQEWDASIPRDCNIGVTLSLSAESPELVSQLGQALAEIVRQPVHHHRTWLGPGESVTRVRIFRPE